MTSKWFRAWFALVFCAALAMMVFTFREWRDCRARGGIFIATQYTWPICLDREVLR